MSLMLEISDCRNVDMSPENPGSLHMINISKATELSVEADKIFAKFMSHLSR